jgi:uncharacterized membrane protein YphA (DoxX/SURF4 family)
MASSRYYPGFVAALCIVLLRIAIGWHFLFEGWEKLESTLSGHEPFSAEVYLRNATGPLAPYFRGMLPDVNGLALLDPARLKSAWSEEVERISDAYGFTADQRTKAQELLEASSRDADYWFSNPDNAEQRRKYYHDLRRVQETEANPHALAYELERAWEARRSLDTDRRNLTRVLADMGNRLSISVAKLATTEQLASAGPVAAPWTRLDVINLLTIYGLIAIGICLMAGFLTPLAALGAAAFLTLIYLSMPPWPGLPPNPKAEGHYLIVSKNLVELLACLVVAATPSGHWVGFDALFFGARRRRRLARHRGEQDQQQRGQVRERERDPIPIG